MFTGEKIMKANYPLLIDEANGIISAWYTRME